jgi:acyl-CoA synthetase (AMP-forming)/AMP-acid ligase II
MIIKGPYSDVEIPDIALTPFVLQRAVDFPNKPALIDGPTGRTLTYSEFATAVSNVASNLAQRGFKKGDVFGIYSPNNPEYAVAFHAVASLGGIVTPINPLYTQHEIAYQLKDAGARYLVTTPGCFEKASAAAAEAGVDEIFSFGNVDGATPFDALLVDNGPPPVVNIDPANDLVVLPYSSGTTGLPKGVMLTHRNLVANLRQMEGLDYFFETDTLICVLPLFHIYGLVVILNMGLYTCATVVMMPRFELESFLQAAQDYEVSLAHIVPPIVLGLAKHPVVENYRLPKLRTIFSGAAPLGAELSEACMARLGCQIRQGYGMTETSPVTHSSPASPFEVKLGSVGVPAPNTECKVIDLETGEMLPAGQRGEVCVRGPQVMKGYLNNPEATAQTIDKDGWLHTGDIGYFDDEAHFFIVDRAKELIKYKGFQVPPAELEAVLLSHPSVADAAVIPFPDDEAGEVPKAVIVLKDQTDTQTILDFVAQRVAPHKRIRHVEVVDKIPKSPSGKILRRVLLDRERAKTAGSSD